MKTTHYNVIDTLIFADKSMWISYCAIYDYSERDTEALKRALQALDATQPVQETIASAVEFSHANNYRWPEALVPLRPA